MALVPLTGVVSAATLNANLDDKSVSLLSGAKAGKKDICVPLLVSSLADTTALSARSVTWAQQDDAELRVVTLRVTDTTAGRAITARLSIDDDDDLLSEQVISVSVATIVGSTGARVDFRTTTGVRVRLLRGVRYRLSLENATAATTVNGTTQAVVQMRTRRRSAGLRSQVPLVPRRIRDTANLDVEAINDDLEAIAKDVQRNLDQRYTFGAPLILPLDGATNASAAALRELPLRRLGANNAIEVCAMELVVCATAGATWTLTCSDTTVPALSLTTIGTTSEASAQLSMPAPIPSSTADVTFTAACATASTITRGYIALHTRADRGQQGSSHAGYTPTLLDASSSTAGSVLDTELQGLEAAANRDSANGTDLRCEVVSARNVAAGGTVIHQMPSGARRLEAIRVYSVQTLGGTVTVTAASASMTTHQVAALAAAGPTTRATAQSTNGQTSMVDDPMDATDDLQVTIQVATQTAQLVIVLLWWS